MLQITEDTPPDMLAGAMDLTVHLPTGRSVKMSVERSTPMMDLLVQITTNYHLQHSGYTLQALGMAPSKDHSDTILPYKPNTPIGALDTQHIKVIAKARQMPVPKNVPPGHQPFESTFRLKVHLPRNQLFVTRVSQSVILEDIMKKVCEEKNLDNTKYEFRHPGNLDEILDPKLTLNDYTITEIYLVQKGTGSLNQTFSTSDIMALRKEEERKQMHNKTGGGVFNLIFRRGKSSTGSLSSENRSISPTHSDDSRSVTPPGVQPEPAERPKPPQRKRRPAPKPPTERKNDGLTVCHSRNSSDSSGYHEASILSDNCNTSLPRRPKSTIIVEEHSQSTSNLAKMAVHSKSTSSLAFPNRKKKTAPPPPPPVLKPEKSQPNLEEPSPVVASQPCIVAQTEPGYGQDSVANINPKPTPRIRNKTAPNPRPRSLVSDISLPEAVNEAFKNGTTENEEKKEENNVETVNKILTETAVGTELEEKNAVPVVNEKVAETRKNEILVPKQQDTKISSAKQGFGEDTKQEISESKIVVNSAAAVTTTTDKIPVTSKPVTPTPPPDQEDFEQSMKQKLSTLAQLQKSAVSDIFVTKVKPPEVVALHPKPTNAFANKSMFDSYTRKRGFQIGSSLLDLRSDEDIGQRTSRELSTSNSVASALNAFEFDDEIEGLDVEMFTGSLSKHSKNKSKILNQLHGMHALELKKTPSSGSLRSVSSLPPGLLGTNMKKWDNVEELDDISLQSNGGRSGWVVGDTSDTESVASTNRTPLESLTTAQKEPETVKPEEKPTETIELKNVEPIEPPKNNELEADWQYQLPSPPKAFRDSSPVTVVNESADSVVTSPELFEKLTKVVKDQSEKETVSDITSMVSEDDKPILNKLSLENLEKRKSLVYNRELATSLKMSEDRKDTFSTSLITFEKTYDEVKQSSPRQSTLPNFKITTYNNPKQKVDIFEDDTVRSNERKRNSVELQKTYIGRSMENISYRKNSEDKTEYKFFRPPAPKPVIFRSESFTKEQKWVPTKPVSRSKSQVAINKYQESKSVSQDTHDDNLTKSNSLFDVSGLQSLEVMRLIQNKLNTPNTSSEQLDKESYQKPPEPKVEVQKEEKPRTYRYTPPAVNMSTWSERPKIPVNVKEDPDYKYSSSKLIVNTVNNDVKSHNTVNVKVTPAKTNGFDQPTQNSGNVVIKIGGNTKPVFRKPLGNVNTDSQRPHSIAFGSDFDISRVPIVRSVEFKKPYKDYHNTSITQILPSDNFTKETENKPQQDPKPVFRVNSYLQNVSTPVVRGFRTQPNSFSTLPAKTRNYSLNAPVPFTQSNLRRTESTSLEKSAPPAPVMPKVFHTTNKARDDGGDPKEQLLQAIRDFGGKKGLRAVKA